MSLATQSLVSQVKAVSSTDIQEPKAPVQVPNGIRKKSDEKKTKRAKYTHVAAFHRDARPSCLSHETVETPSFLGFRNLMVLVIIVMNLRLVVENARKYGLLITLKSNIRGSDVKIGFVLYALTPCHLFVAYIIERIAMENAKSAVGRRKKEDSSMSTPETDKDRKEFNRTWWWIAFAHGVNASLALLVTTVVVYYVMHNPALGAIAELHAIVVWLKTCSYAFTNRDLRHAMLHPSEYSAMLPEIYLQCPYPRNITLSNLCYFWWAPTLVYQPIYPRTDRIRWGFVAKRVGEVIALSIFIWVCSAQYAKPVLTNSLSGMAVLDYPSIAERLMKLSIVTLLIWLAGFFALFQSFLNAVAEVTRFGDRVFYEDWWNSTNLKDYWSNWNKPVYHFMRRHIYTPLRGRGWSHHAASASVFIFSGILHELVVGVPAHDILGIAFLGMVLQLPLIQVTEPLGRAEGITAKVIGNCIFWINFVFVGQPLAAMIYFFSYQAKYGDLSSTRQTGTWTFSQYFDWMVSR